MDEIQNTLSTTVLEHVMGYTRYSYHLYGFRSYSGLRNMLGFYSKTVWSCMDSLLAIDGDRGSEPKLQKVVFLWYYQ